VTKRKGIGSSTGRGIGGSSSQGTLSPVGDKAVVIITRVNGKTRLVEEVATGRYNSKTSRWEFSSPEAGSVRWLEKTFNNPPAGHYINNAGFLYYLMQIVMPRKGWLMDWNTDGKTPDGGVGKKYQSPFDLTPEELAEITRPKAKAGSSSKPIDGKSDNLIKKPYSENIFDNLFDLDTTTPEPQGQIRSAAGSPSPKEKEKDKVGGDARHQPLVELGRAMLLAPNPKERRRIHEETRAKRAEMGLSDEEEKAYSQAVMSMWAEEAVKAWANDDEKIQKRLDQMVAQLGAEDAAFYGQQLREQRAAFLLSGSSEPKDVESEEGSEEDAEGGELQSEDVVTTGAEDKQKPSMPSGSREMRSTFMDFVVDCSARANWVGYGRAMELLCEFLDQFHQSGDNQDLIDHLNFSLEGVDIGTNPERLSAQELISIYGREHNLSDEDMLGYLCSYVDEMDANHLAMGFFEDMVEYHEDDWK